MQIKPKANEKFYGLDHLRALAIIWVFLYHYHAHIFGHPEWLPPIAKFGWTGVDLFFVLSGFLISSQLFAQLKEHGKVEIGSFFVKRFFRIIPAYWVVLAIYFCFPSFHEREHLLPLWRYVLFLQNFGLDLLQYGTFSHAWSLCVEEHFYLLLPIILLLLSATGIFRRAYWLLPLLFCATIFTRYYAYTNIYLPATENEGAGIVWYKVVYYPTYCRLDGLLIGVAIAAAYTFLPRFWNIISVYGNGLLLLSLLVLTAGYFICYDEHSYYASVFGFAVVSVGYGLMVIAALSPTCFLYRWKSRVAAAIAALSYGIYLSHKGVIHITQVQLDKMGIDINSNTCMTICIFTCIVAAILLYVIIERSFMTLRRRLVKTA